MDEATATPQHKVAHGSSKRWRVCWTKKIKGQFLDHLAATCNISAAARLIGVDTSSVYALRRRDPDFASAWGEALAAGYQMLETQLVGHAMAGGGPDITNGDAALGPIDVNLAMQLLVSHRTSVRGPNTPRRYGLKRDRATREEADVVILRTLAAMEKKLGITA